MKEILKFIIGTLEIKYETIKIKDLKNEAIKYAHVPNTEIYDELNISNYIKITMIDIAHKNGNISDEEAAALLTLVYRKIELQRLIGIEAFRLLLDDSYKSKTSEMLHKQLCEVEENLDEYNLNNLSLNMILEKSSALVKKRKTEDFKSE